MSSWIAAATSYSTNDVPMIPFYIYYSMFGFQRVGDLAWAAGDMRARGFLLGGTAGRTTLNGEGLQHEDGHSHVLVVDDPELRLLRPDLRLRGRGHRPGRPAPDVRRAGGRLLLHHPDERELRAPGACPRAPRRASSRACTCCARAKATAKAPRVQLLGCGTILREVMAGGRPAARGLGRGRRRLERAQLHRAAPRRPSTSSAGTCCTRARRRARACVEQCLEGRQGPVVAATDYIQTFADQIRPFVPPAATACSAPTASAAPTTARKLRHFFEVDRRCVALAALEGLADEGAVPRVDGRRGDQEVRHRPGEAEPGTV